MITPEKNPSPTEEAVVLKNVSKRFHSAGREVNALDSLSARVKPGTVTGFVGPDGGGKTTLFRMMAGLLPASEGSLMVAGNDLRRAAARARDRIGYMAQRFSLYANLSVFENLRFFSSAYGLKGQRQRKRIAWALKAFELKAYAEAKSGDLPLGFKQRLSLATALMHEPEILFLDEPTSGVDPLARREFWNRINGLAQGGVTVLVTTHFMEEAEYCDRLVIMAEGEILEEGTPDDIKARHRSDSQSEPSMEDAFIALIREREGRA
ncbi:ABC transporter, ATP-binding protein [delta proteobacterium NaphS2]|nr:ABC transporter, ATP-binding protein [delta proteobacterium NaphS2]